MSEPLIPYSPGDDSGKAAAPRPHPGSITEVRLQTRIQWRRVGWMGSLFLLLGLVVYIAAQVRPVTIPMLVAFTIAYILDPIVDSMERRGMSRTASIIVLMFVSLLGSAAWIIGVGPIIWDELVHVPERLQQLLVQGRPWIEHTFRIHLPTDIDSMVLALQDELMGPDTDSSMAGLVRRFSNLLRTVFGGTVSILASSVGIIMLPFFVFYLLRDFPLLVSTVQNLVPLPYRAAVQLRLREIDLTLNAFLRGQLLLGCILAVYYGVGFTLWGVPLGLVLGISTGLCNMIPYMGTVLGLTTATLLTLLSWQGWPQLAGIYAMFAVGHALEGWVITPRIVGNRVGLSPFFVITAVLVFGELFGFFGVLVAVPVTAILRILLRVATEHYRASSFYRGDFAPP